MDGKEKNNRLTPAEMAAELLRLLGIEVTPRTKPIIIEYDDGTIERYEPNAKKDQKEEKQID